MGQGGGVNISIFFLPDAGAEDGGEKKEKVEDVENAETKAS